MFSVLKSNTAALDRDSQFQVDFLLECIERYEKQQAKLVNMGKSSTDVLANPITTRSVLSREELAMLTTLF
ncbi:hypothetical protein MSG37_12650 [Shewanella sp. 1CM18E]|uniref:hypothetical protein n=1 Tax=Shewanella sp. 1CM18E TaxID=2929169 RepID=UPI0020BE8236|nr:hypothetical protein [Shewanella sp. 1CM18E]MCK8045734.1 hypothetical protein [Shewanella sp. 1CM18E]